LHFEHLFCDNGAVVLNFFRFHGNAAKSGSVFVQFIYENAFWILLYHLAVLLVLCWYTNCIISSSTSV